VTKNELLVIKDVLAHARRRAGSTASDGERLWLHTYVLPQLEDALARAEGRAGKRRAERSGQ